MKFFNSLRRKLVGPGFKKYLLYAFGEILLVVIGILLAISINEHYAKVDLDNKNLENTKQIYAQMQADSTEVTRYIKFLGDLRKTVAYLISPKEEREKNKPKKSLGKYTRLGLFFDRDSDFINLSNLVPTQIQNGNFSSTDYAQLLFNIQVDYSSDLRGIYDQEDVIQDHNKRFNSYLAENYTWYTNWSANLNCNRDCMNFVGSNKKFDVMLSLYSYEKTVIYLDRIETFQEHLHQNMKQLRAVLDAK